MKKFSRAMLVALLLALAAVAPVQAARNPKSVYDRVVSSADPSAAAQRLSKADRAALRTYLTPVERRLVKEGPTPARTLAAGCQQTGHAVGVFNALGVLLWTWNMYAEWCYDGSRFTASYARSSGVTYVLFWSWKEMSSSKYINTALNPDKLSMFSQAEFKLCLFGNIGCTTYRYPWIELRAYANGPFSWHGAA